MKKLLYALLVIAYFTVAYLSVFILPHYFWGPLMWVAGVSLGGGFRQYKEIKKSPEKPLSAYFKWGRKATWFIFLVILGEILLVSFISESNWLRGVGVLLAVGYGGLWQVLHIQFLRKYYFKNA